MNYHKAKEVFESKYHVGSDWGGHSGGGSSTYHTIEYRAFLERFIFLNNIQTVVDIGCGDWQFSKHINYSGVKYTGYDIVPSVVQSNSVNYSKNNIKFLDMPNNLEEVQGADLLIMKDVLQHLPNNDIFNFKKHVFPKYKYCIITNSFSKVASQQQNKDIALGGFRCLDLNATPFNFNGIYVMEFFSPLWETIRVLLLRL
jgi:2-polyprenyl-3-methyl-5-hydroxy-6-metoxy-1,4-benzoquinol methylase